MGFDVVECSRAHRIRSFCSPDSCGRNPGLSAFVEAARDLRLICPSQKAHPQREKKKKEKIFLSAGIGASCMTLWCQVGIGVCKVLFAAQHSAARSVSGSARERAPRADVLLGQRAAARVSQCTGRCMVGTSPIIAQASPAYCLCAARFDAP